MIILPPDIFCHAGPDEVVRDEDAGGGCDDGDEGALEDPVEVPGGDVDEDVSPGEGEGDDGVQQPQDDYDDGVVLVLGRNQHPANVIAEEVTCKSAVCIHLRIPNHQRIGEISVFRDLCKKGYISHRF